MASQSLRVCLGSLHADSLRKAEVRVGCAARVGGPCHSGLLVGAPLRRGLQNVVTSVATTSEQGTASENRVMSEMDFLLEDEVRPCTIVEANEALLEKCLERKSQRNSEQTVYKLSAVVASVGVSALAVSAIYYKFALQSEGGSFPTLDAVCTAALTLGGIVGMEMWARWAHKALWHDYQPGWALHESHHVPRVGPFEKNDVFAVVNAIPAMSLCAYGFLTPTLGGGICFGFGLGITIFGMMYMFIHDGLVHRRFPVGPIADLPYMRRVAVAHKLHHSEKYKGVPWGLFLGPQELEAIGGKEDLDRLCLVDMDNHRDKSR